MAIERMEMVNIIGQYKDAEDVAKRLIMSSSVHMVNALTQIYENNFPILKARNSLKESIDINHVRQYSGNSNSSSAEIKINALMEILGCEKKVLEEHLRERYDFDQDMKEIDNIYSLVEKSSQKLKKIEDERNELALIREQLKYIEDLDLNFSNLLDMKYIDFKVGKLPRYNVEKLKRNYENIPAIIFKVYQDKDIAVVILFIPKGNLLEIEALLETLNFTEFKFNIKFNGNVKNWVDEIEKREKEIKDEYEGIKSNFSELELETRLDVEKFYSRFKMQEKIDEAKGNMAETTEFFFFSGWIPKSKKDNLINSLESYGDKLIIVFNSGADIKEGVRPPTSLRNAYLLRPFETIVKLYGIPAYNETDPTSFVGLSYLFLFGAMFGDVGQGLVLFILGEILNRIKRRPNLGGLLSRLGISSTVFGFVYGSVFGFEDILKWDYKPIKPMASINFLLIAAVVLGVFLLTAGFFYNFLNCIKNKNIEEGVFGRNGLAGLIFYWLVLYTLISKVMNYKTFIPITVLAIIMILMLILTMLKEPLANIVTGKRPIFNEEVSDYFIESGFGVMETILTFFSNTVSFIRVGAFAINHVGLFIAFETLSHMINSSFGSWFVIFLGNIIIIGLEGLIVFIQGLRLEYYELFSKFFDGSGYEYNPIKLRGIY